MGKFARSNGSPESEGEIGDKDNGQAGGGSASPRTKSTTRRNLLQFGAGFAAVTGLSRGLAAPAVARDPIEMPRAPNIIVLMTDQERHHVHWPQGWAEKICPRCNGSSGMVSIFSAPTRLHVNAHRRAG